MDRIDITEHGRLDGFLIRGITHAQKTFRPSDWPERLAGVITLFVGERRPGYPCALTRLACPSSTAASNACSCRASCAPCARMRSRSRCSSQRITICLSR